MSHMTDAELDNAILAHCDARFAKVARIAMKATEMNSDVFDRAVERIAWLVAAGKLEAVGDVTNPRYSEVRLPSH